MKRVSLEQLVSAKGEISYLQQYQYITELMENGKIKPLKASKTNGKKPALYREYWLIEPEKDYSALKEELKYRLHGRIDVDYYLEHPQVYERERPWVLKLSDYLKKNREKLEYKVSVNERSFEIWNREKFLTKEQGKAVLKHCGIGEDFLNTYGTSEPLSYYSSIRRTPQNMVILENKDTFYSMRSHLLGGHERILGMPVGIYYFGDLDYEGIGIYERLASLFQEEWEIVPFVSAYERMLKKAEDGGLDGLPETKEQQNRKISGAFFQYFSEESSEKMRAVIDSGRYIPQEILNISDFCR